MKSFRNGEVKVAQSCPTLCDSMGCTVHGILQARILEWVAFPFSRGSSQPRDQTQISHIACGFFTSWAILQLLALLHFPSEHALGSLSVARKLHEALFHSRLHPQLAAGAWHMVVLIHTGWVNERLPLHTTHSPYWWFYPSACVHTHGDTEEVRSEVRLGARMPSDHSLGLSNRLETSAALLKSPPRASLVAQW